jgi:hypothetical protein
MIEREGEKSLVCPVWSFVCQSVADCLEQESNSFCHAAVIRISNIMEHFCRGKEVV